MEEQKIENYLVKKVKEAGGKAFKFVSPGNSGVPDRLIIFPKGIISFVELKAPGEKPRKLQKAIINQLRKLDCRVYVIDSKDKVDSFIKIMDIVERSI